MDDRGEHRSVAISGFDPTRSLPAAHRSSVDVQRNRILIVDDDGTVADTTAMLFTQNGYDGRAAYSAEQALALIREWPPTVAILDVRLPEMNGIALARLMQLACPECWVALMSTRDFGEETLSAIPDGLPFIEKPIAPDSLLAFVGEALLAMDTFRPAMRS